MNVNSNKNNNDAIGKRNSQVSHNKFSIINVNKKGDWKGKNIFFKLN